METKQSQLGQNLVLRNKTEKAPSLGTRLQITLIILLIIHSVSFIPIPYIDYKTFLDSVKNINSSSNSFLGGNFNSVSLFRLGIVPYITASIIMQVLIKLNPKLSRLQKDGDYGRRKINNYLRYLTFLCAIFQSISQTYTLRNFFDSNLFIASQISLCLISGSMIMLWFSEIITKNGLSNGPSLFICFNILSALPDQLLNLTQKYYPQDLGGIINTGIILVAFLFTTMSCVVIEEGALYLPLLSARQQIINFDKKKSFFFKNQNTLPLRINAGGVMPLIFTSSAMSFFSSLGQKLATFLDRFSLPVKLVEILTFQNAILYWLLYGVTILFFSKLYSRFILDPNEIAEQLRKNSVVIKKIGPGKSTKNYLIKKIDYLAKLNALGFFLIFFVVNLVGQSIGISSTNFTANGINSQIILTSVLMDMLRRINSFVTIDKATKTIKNLADKETLE